MVPPPDGCSSIFGRWYHPGLFSERFAPIMGQPDRFVSHTEVNTMNSTLTSVLTALIIPIGWGLLSAWLFDRWRAWRQPERQQRDVRGDDRSPGAVR